MDVSPPVVASSIKDDTGGSYEVEAPRSHFWRGGGGDVFPLGRGETGDRAVPLPVLRAELEAPQDLPLAQRGPVEWVI